MHKYSCPPFQGDAQKGADKLEEELQAIPFRDFSPVYNVRCPFYSQDIYTAWNT